VRTGGAEIGTENWEIRDGRRGVDQEHDSSAVREGFTVRAEWLQEIGLRQVYERMILLGLLCRPRAGAEPLLRLAGGGLRRLRFDSAWNRGTDGTEIEAYCWIWRTGSSVSRECVHVGIISGGPTRSILKFQ
jgi:hypothetical protein